MDSISHARLSTRCQTVWKPTLVEERRGPFVGELSKSRFEALEIMLAPSFDHVVEDPVEVESFSRLRSRSPARGEVFVIRRGALESDFGVGG
jgi:hypothetical protein